jgi:hypothetical protein
MWVTRQDELQPAKNLEAEGERIRREIAVESARELAHLLLLG